MHPDKPVHLLKVFAGIADEYVVFHGKVYFFVTEFYLFMQKYNIIFDCKNFHFPIFQNLSKNIQIPSLPPIAVVVIDAEEGAGKGADFAKGDEDAGIDDPYGWEEDATVEQPHSRKGEQGCCGQVDDAEVHPRVCIPRAPARAEATAMMMRITVSHTDRDLPELLVLSDVFIVPYWFKGDFSLFYA